MDIPSIPEQTKQLMDDLGFSEASPETQQKIIDQLQQMVDTEILYALASRLTDEQINELDNEIKGASEDATMKSVIDKLKTMIPDYEEVVGRAIDELYQRLKADSKSVSEFISNSQYRDEMIGKKDTQINHPVTEASPDEDNKPAEPSADDDSMTDN